jgi:hypothetical protein
MLYAKMKKKDKYLFYKTKDFKCAICGSNKLLCVDHNHKNGLVRSVLCSRCNGWVGDIENAADDLYKTLVYVRKFERKASARGLCFMDFLEYLDTYGNKHSFNYRVFYRAMNK